MEFKGKNVDKALEKASAKLKIPKNQIKYDILSYGSSGIFGLAGTKKARIRVNVDNETQNVETVAALETKSPDTDVAVEAENISETSTEDLNISEEEVSDHPDSMDFPQEAIDIGRDVLQRIIDAITSDAHITLGKDSQRVSFNVAGGNPAILIGKRGQTLEAIQSLVEKVVNKHRNNDNRIRVQVDVEGYLETRKENLEQLANRLAEKAQRIRKPISMGQMSAHDRRIVHLALKDHPGVNTQSRGEGYLRKLVIFPKRKNAKTHKNSNYKNG
ncbi:MAG: Jag N-terminal domain-containing protein [Deltaproteobacteria bacterium]|jgi:spoIIIJ-associated protein|nr:Jag N-terminal domain-containing protein [Deltaproteobacteria bacterium]